MVYRKQRLFVLTFETDFFGRHGFAEIDGTPEVRQFAETLEDVIIKTVEAGHMTKDLAALVGNGQGYQTTDEFMATLAENLRNRLG